MLKKLVLSAVAAVLVISVIPASAVVEPKGSELLSKTYWHPQIRIQNQFAKAADLRGGAQSLAGSLEAVGATPQAAMFDQRAGRWSTLVMTTPLVPGSGTGNRLRWDSLGGSAPSDDAALGTAAADAFNAFVAANHATFGVETDEMVTPRVGVTDGGRLIQMYIARRVNGVPVRDSYMTAVVNSGNLVLYGMRNWGPMNVSTEPGLAHEAAAAVVREHLAGAANVGGHRAKPRLEIVPLNATDSHDIGAGYDYRLAWVISPEIRGDQGSWEALVDANNGELLSFNDTNHYQTTRTVTGGVLPITNDGLDDSGTEQPDWPMPFADVTEDNTSRLFVTDSAGNLPACVTGDITTHLDSRYVKMVDGCNPVDGTISVSSADPVMPNIDLGFAPPAASGTDCTASTNPAVGNTRASRSGFYEVNRIMEQARGYLPGNVWLTEQLTANMNIQDVCNAFWNGSSINFYKFSGACSNTGEIAGVFDHEWGHGMDDNDVFPSVSRPGEGIADAYMFFRLNTSCVGRNFSDALGCNGPTGGNGDPCINNCNGVREMDYHQRQSGNPHDVNFALSNCSPAGATNTPCGGGTHCEGAIYSEALFDLARRDLRCQGAGGWVDDGPPFDGPVEGGACAGGAATMDNNTAYELAARLTYAGAGVVNFWYDCVTDGTGGCSADGGYLNFLAADDDNGNLLDGTPHMTSIYDAFDRHGIACPSLVPANSGCAGGPTAAPLVTTTPLDRAVRVEWPTVPGADSYTVYRSEGIFGCDAGKAPLGVVQDADCAGGNCQFVALGLKNGFEYYFNVLPNGTSTGLTNTCVGTMSACATEIPSIGPNLAIDSNGSLNLTNVAFGDNDEFLDNCEDAEFTFDVFNTGDTPLTGVQVVSVSSPTHPGMTFDATPITVGTGSLAVCESGSTTIGFTAFGLSYQDDVEFEVVVTADQLPVGGNQTAVLRFLQIGQSDYQFFASGGPDFETDDFFPFEVVGVYNRTDANPPGPAGAGTFYGRSSALVDGVCDELRTPLIRLTGTSTLSFSNQYDIEPHTPTPYDRANVGIIDFASGLRADVIPSSGRPYDIADGSPNGACAMEGQPGWASTSANFGTAAGWAAVGFDNAALTTEAPVGVPVQLSILYGTDGGLALQGFFVDDIELTDFELQVPDTQVCGTNLDPVAADDAAETVLNTLVSIDVMANDSDPEGQPLSINSFDAATTQGGAVALNDNGTPGDASDDRLDYTPPGGFSSGPLDTFTYTISDGVNTSTAATVSVNVLANRPPDAAGDLASTTQDVAIVIDVLANDSDPDGDPITLTGVDSPTSQGGTATINDAGTPGNPADDFINYTPPAGFTSPPTDAFVYTISDGAETDTAVVSVTVTGACPSTPTGSFFDDVESVVAGYQSERAIRQEGGWERFDDDVDTETSPVNIWFVEDIADPVNLLPADHRLVLPPQFLSSTSELQFFHNFDFGRFPTASEATSYQSGGVLEISDDGTTWVDLEAYITTGGYNGTVDADASNNLNPLRTRNAYVGSSDIGPPNNNSNSAVPGRAGDPMADHPVVVDLGAAILAEYGASSLPNALIRFRFGGTFQVLTNGVQGTGWGIDDVTVTNTVEQANCPPIAIDDNASTDVDTQVFIDALGNDADPNPGDPISFFSVVSPTANNGTATIDDNGTPGNPADDLIAYTPDTGFSGSDTFDYTIEDGGGLQDTATVTVEVGNSGGGCTPDTVLFADAFESGDTSAWDFVRNPQGDLTIGNLGLEGFFGMEIGVDHSNVRTQRHHYVAKTHADTDTYCWSFLFDPNSIDIPLGKFIRIWGARGNNNRRLLELAIRNIGGTYHVATQVVKDGGVKAAVPFAPIPDGPVLIGGEWSNTAAGGVLKLFLNGVEQPGSLSGVTAVSRDLRTPGMGNLGQFRKGTLGSMYFDQFVGGPVAP